MPVIYSLELDTTDMLRIREALDGNIRYYFAPSTGCVECQMRRVDGCSKHFVEINHLRYLHKIITERLG